MKLTFFLTFLLSQVTIFILTFELGFMSQFIDMGVNMGVGGLKAFSTEEGSRLRIIFPYKSLATLVVGSNAPLTNSINSRIGKHL